jgi:hypothetical protein
VPYDNFSKDNSNLKIIPALQKKHPLYPMVMIMNEKKDPHPKNNPIDLDDDDDIIELTTLVALKPKDNVEIADKQDTQAAAPQKASDIPATTDQIELKADDEEDLIELGERLDADSQADAGIFDLGELDSDDDNFLAEDDIIASKIEASSGDDDDDLQQDPIEVTVEVDTISEQYDDTIILNTEDEAPAALSDPGEPVSEKEEAILDSEEEIELEYKSDEDEYDFFALDDKKTFQEPETIPMADEDPDDPVDDRILFDPVETDELSLDEDNQVLAMDADPQEGTDFIALDVEETLKFSDSSDLPDLTAEMGFDFDDENDENGLDAADDQTAESSDDIIARAVEKSLAPGEVTAQIDLAMLPEFEFTEDDGIMAEDDEQAAAEDLTAKTMEGIRELAEEDYLPDIDDDSDLEFEDDDGAFVMDDISEREIEDNSFLLEDIDESDAGEQDDITEITELDQHFPEIDENVLERAAIVQSADSDEDGDLELIEVEEDDPADDEKAADFSYSEAQNDEEQIDRFFSETLGSAPLIEIEEIEAVEETPALSTDMAMATTLTEDEDEEFDFRLDSSEISDQVDRLDTFLSEDSTAEPEVATLFEEPYVEEEAADEHLPAIEDTARSIPVAPDQIESIIERVVNDKLGGKIEGIIYEVIEKAVSKEIDRLKGALLDNTGHGDIE